MTSFVIESVALDVGGRDRLYVFGEDKALTLHVRAFSEITVDGKPWPADAPLLRLAGTLYDAPHRVYFTPDDELGGGAHSAEFVRAVAEQLRAA